MPKLKTIYDKLEDIPEGQQELYTEKNGKFELTGVEGIKTQADIDRINEALRKEKADHKTTKEKLTAFGDLDATKIPDALAELESVKAQLEVATKEGANDPKKHEALVDAAVKRALGPVEREKTQLQRDLDKARGDFKAAQDEVGTLKSTIRNGTVEQALRDAAIAANIITPALDDAIMVTARMCELTDDGRILTKDEVGVAPGLTPTELFKDMQEKKPHWYPASQGGNSRGGGGQPPNRAENPWTKEGWNITAQGQFVKQHGAVKAAEFAKQAGVTLGSTHPVEKAA